MTPVERGLAQVRRLREMREQDPELGAKVASVKAYQHARLKRDYIGWLADPRFRPAAQFFLEQLYGPHDFGDRDAQFARIVPALRRMLSEDLQATVLALIELHVLTEGFDHEMAGQLAAPAIDDANYRRSWKQVGRPSDRERQVVLMLEIGRSLDRHTRRPLVAATLRLMRGPAHAAGLGDLQAFLEAGFGAFKAMNGAEDFLQAIARNERGQIAALFSD